MNLQRLLILTFAHFTVDLYGGFLLPIIPALENHFNVSIAALIALSGFCATLVNIIQPFTGRLALKFKYPFFLVFGPITAASMAFIGLAPTFFVFVVIAITSHIGTGVFHPEGLLFAQNNSGSKAHIGVPVFLSCGFFGWSLGTLASATWYTHFGFKHYWLFAIPGILATILILLNRFDRESKISYQSSKAQTDEKNNFSFGTNFHIIELTILSCFLVLPATTTFVFLSKHLQLAYSESIGVEWSGRALAIIGVCSAISSYIWGYLSKRISPLILAGIGQLIAIPLILLFINASPGTELIIYSIFLGMFIGSAFFPIIAIGAKNSRGLSAHERAGWIVGGSWGIAGLVQIGLAELISYGITITQIQQFSVVFMFIASIWSFILYKKERSLN